MRKGLFLGALLATMLVGGTAFADRNDDNDKSSNNRGRSIKEQVLEKQKEGYKARTSSRSDAAGRRDLKQNMVKGVQRQKGEVYGDQGTRTGGQSKMSSAAGKNMSASGRVNTPAEVRAMIKMIHPMFGAYRTSQADSGTDSYGGNEMSRISAGQGGQANIKNRSASGKINTPAEIKQFKAMINPLNTASSGSPGSADSYSDTNLSQTRLMNGGKGAQRYVHFKNERGEVVGAAKAGTDTAAKNKLAREKLTKMVSDKMAKAKQ